MKNKIIFILFFVSFLQTTLAQSPFFLDYSKMWTTKMFLSKPDGKGGCLINNTFEEALEDIKKADMISLGVPKIVYLVGWQYNGHDDKYPAFFAVNDLLKRKEDKDGLTSLRWLMKEAKKYHTTVSLHINMTDAYDDSPLWELYKTKDLISKEAGGKLMVIGEYNGRKAYQINYRKEWEAGMTQWRIDQLLSLLPELRDGHTIHADAWIARASEGDNETVVTEAMYQQKAALYWRAKGLDITTEWVMDYMTGYVPLYWHFNGHSQADYLRIPANVCCGVGLNPDLKKSDFGLGFLFGESCYGEPFWGKSFWTKSDSSDDLIYKDFMRKFPQFYFLNSFKRLGVEGEGDHRVALYSSEVKVSLKDRTISQNNHLLRKGSRYIIPALWRTDQSVVIYSEENEKVSEFDKPYGWDRVKTAQLYEITTKGLLKQQVIKLNGLNFKLSIRSGRGYLLIPGE